jgi:threonine/homoserine/homoserine lactone efflux protein
VPLNVWAFTAITAPLVATPGASTAVVLRNSLAGGMRSGVATAVGTNTGSVCFGALTAFGLSAALERWPLVWLGLRIGGGA